MAVWIPLLKAALPYVTQIVATTIPAFTSKPGPPKVDDVTAQQIVELQSAVTQNAESIHILAEKLQQTIQGIDLAATSLQKDLKAYKRLAFMAVAIASVSLITAVIALIP